MKKINYIRFTIILLAALLTGCSSAQSDNNELYFGKSTYSETKHKCSDEDRKTIQPVLDQAEAAFSYIDENNDCKDKFGELSRYCLSKSSYPEIVSENHNIEFVTAEIKGDSGYIWIKYNQSGIGGNDQEITASKDILSRIEIKKTDEIWTVSNVNEAP